jgi:hypothetical protein
MISALVIGRGGGLVIWRVLSVVTLTSILTLGCATERSTADTVQLETSQLPIKGGYNSADLAVVGLGMASQGGFGTCSGTIISENVILTAQHCIADMSTESYVDCNQSTFGSSQSPGYVFVTNASPMPWDESSYVRCQEILVPQASNWACGFDVALLILEEPVPGYWNTTPMIPRVDTGHTSNDPYSAIGYGSINGQGQGSGTRRRRDDLYVECGPGECPTWYPLTASEWIGDAGVCQGDSGGPAIDEFNRVIGVASRGGAECSSPVYSGVNTWGDWIKDTVVYAAELNGLNVPAWALGWPTHPDYSYAIGGWCDSGADCDSGLCVGSICTRRCNDLAPCPTGLFCNDDELCEVVPVGGRCSVPSECIGGWCLDGACSRTCSDDMPCPTGFECDPVAVGCRPEIGVPCTDNAACTSEICLGDLCTRECDADLDCPDGWNCTNGACLLDKVGMGCKDDLACPGGYCVDGLCTRACATNTPCPAGYLCDADDGICQLVPAGNACTDNMDCSYTLCVDGICTRTCSNEAPCPAGLYCEPNSGMCEKAEVGGTCTEDEACDSGICVDGLCTRGCGDQTECPAGYRCDQQQSLCILVDAGGTCTDDSDCNYSVCVDGICTRACSTEAPCPSGLSCDAGSGLCVVEGGSSERDEPAVPVCDLEAGCSASGCSDPSLTGTADCLDAGATWGPIGTRESCVAAGHTWGPLETEEACLAAGSTWTEGGGGCAAGGNRSLPLTAGLVILALMFLGWRRPDSANSF